MRALLLACLVLPFTLQAQPKVQSFTLPNGLRVVHLEDHEHPLVRARLHLSIEAADTPAGHEGLAAVVLRVLRESDAAELKPEAYYRLLEDSGIHHSTTLDRNGISWQLVARSRDQDRALGLLADRVLRTVFEASTLEAQKLAAWRQEERTGDSLQAQLHRTLTRWPGATPELASLSATTLDDVLTFKARVFRPDRAVLVLHGDLGIEQAKRLVLLTLGSWSAQEPPPAAVPAVVPALPRPATFPQSAPRFSSPGMGLRLQSVAVVPVDLAPEVLTLLNLLIPGDASLLPVQVAAERDCLVATLDAAAGTAGGEAWSLLHGRLEALRQRGFTQADLERARAVWRAGRSLDSLHPEAQMDAALAEARGRGVLPERMNVLSLEALNTALRTWLDPSRLRSGAVGDAERLRGLPTR